MAESTATRPARTRAARATKTAPAKAAPAKAASKPAAEAVETDVEDYYVDLVHLEDTKSYAKFAPPESMKGVMVGTLYCPLGTEAVKVRISGPKA